MPLLERGVAAEGLDGGGGGGAVGLLLELIGIDFVAELHKARLHVLDCVLPHSLNVGLMPTLSIRHPDDGPVGKRVELSVYQRRRARVVRAPVCGFRP